jgi:hypothetical protein
MKKMLIFGLLIVPIMANAGSVANKSTAFTKETEMGYKSSERAALENKLMKIDTTSKPNNKKSR